MTFCSKPYTALIYLLKIEKYLDETIFDIFRVFRVFEKLQRTIRSVKCTVHLQTIFFRR